MPCTVIVSGFWGDEGKGKIVSYLALKDKVDVAVRVGSVNAGHTVVLNGVEYKLRLIPSAFVNKNCKLYIGPGANVSIGAFFDEVSRLGVKGRVWLDPQCSIIERHHVERELKDDYLSKFIGTTCQGVGPAVEDRVRRVAKLAKDFPELSEYLRDVPMEVNTAINKGEKVMLEGTQGFYLSLFYGTYPYVTSRDTSSAAVCSEAGVPPNKVDEIVLIFKSYMTRVGEGPLIGEIPEEKADELGWSEIATVTRRKRRAAPFNFDLARRACIVNGATQLAVTKLDILFPECRKMTSYKDLPSEAKEFIRRIEEKTKVPVTLIGTGPDTFDIIDLRQEKGFLR